MKVTLIRDHSLPNGTEGRMVIGEMTLFTLEEPWKDNRKGISCIPKGTYKCVPHGWGQTQFKQKKCWEITHVQGRSGILIHVGNTVLDIEGCVLVGMQRGVLKGLPAVLQSKLAMDIMRGVIGCNEFELTIQGV